MNLREGLNTLRKAALLALAVSALLMTGTGVGDLNRWGSGNTLQAQETGPREGSGQGSLGRSASERKIELLRAVAGSLRDEAYAIQQQGRLQDAVLKYRESLVYFPDTGLNDYIIAFEKRAGKPSPTVGPESTQARPFLSASIRNRSRQSIHLLTEGATADASTLFAAEEIRSLSVSWDTQGRITFRATRDGKVIASSVWQRDPGDARKVPVVLFDDKDGPARLTVMTGIRQR